MHGWIIFTSDKVKLTAGPSHRTNNNQVCYTVYTVYKNQQGNDHNLYFVTDKLTAVIYNREQGDFTLRVVQCSPLHQGQREHKNIGDFFLKISSSM